MPRPDSSHAVNRATTCPPFLMTTVSFVLAAALCVGCDKEKAGSGLALKEGLAAAEEAGRIKPLEPADVADAGGLMQVLRRPYATLAPRLGGLTQKVRSAFTLRSGEDRAVSLDETLSLELDATGQYALRHENAFWSKEDEDGKNGRACWWVEGRFYTARRHGPATEVPIRSYEQDRCLATAVEPFAGMLRLLGGGLRPAPAERVEVAGRPALRVGLARAVVGTEIPPVLPRTWPVPESAEDRPGVVEAPTELSDAGVEPAVEAETPAIYGPRRALVEEYGRLMSVEGQVDLDLETGIPLAGRLEGRLAFRKAQRDWVLELEINLEADAFDGTVAAPEKARQYFPRQRLFEDRREVLGEVFKKRGTGALPKPGDAPPIAVRTGDEESPGQAVPTEATPAAGDEDAPPAPQPSPEDEDAPE